MKYFIFIFIGCISLLSACKKITTSKAFPAIENGSVTSLTASQVEWLKQIARQKADSIRIVDSLTAVNGIVDTTSLFHKKNLMIGIVEVNDHYFPNMSCYVDQKGKPVFDLAFAFAANLNINPNTGKPFIKYNTEWTAMNQTNIVKRVRSSGIKVGLSLLGNHDAAGWTTFPNLAAATDFAQLVAFEVRTKGYDAVLSDDEYSEGGTYNPISYVMVMSEIKRLLPDIYLCFYEYGGGSGSYNGKQMGDIADANFQAFYGSPANDGHYNFPASKCFPACSETDGNFSDPMGTVQTTLKKNAGIMFYNVCGRSNSPAFYDFYVKNLKGLTLTVPAGCLNSTEVSGVNNK